MFGKRKSVPSGGLAPANNGVKVPVSYEADHYTGAREVTVPDAQSANELHMVVEAIKAETGARDVKVSWWRNAAGEMRQPGVY